MSVKHTTRYSLDNQLSVLPDDTGLPRHAEHRWRERTPHDRDVGLLEAYQRGNDIPHPSVAYLSGKHPSPDRARVYRHGDQWGVVFLICTDHRPETGVAEVVRTVVAIRQYSHAPSKSYLMATGPHHPGGGCE